MVARTQASWDALFYDIAVRVSERSKDRRKVGAVLVKADRRAMSFGYNGFPPEIPDTAENLANQVLRARSMIHAEDNCLRQSPFTVDEGATMYVTRFPCEHCACKLILAGVARVVAPAPDLAHPRWGASWEHAQLLLELSGIELTEVPCD